MLRLTQKKTPDAVIAGVATVAEILIGAEIENSKNRRSSQLQVDLARFDSEAKIRNELVEIDLLLSSRPRLLLELQIALKRIETILNRSERILADAAFYTTGTETLWFRDPDLAVRAENAEVSYQEAIRAWREEALRLARTLEASWCEEYRNPISRSNGAPLPLGANNEFADFTEANSVFAVADHQSAERYFEALKDWDRKLRVNRDLPDTQERSVNSQVDRPISVRRDCFNLVDYRYDELSNSFIEDPQVRAASIRRFRAELLRRVADQDTRPGALWTLVIDFPFTYKSVRVVPGFPKPQAIVRREIKTEGGIDEFWNQRVTKIGVRLVGTNIFAGASSTQVDIILDGTVERVGFERVSLPGEVLSGTGRAVSTLSLPLYQPRPENLSAPAGAFIFARGFEAVVGSGPLRSVAVDGWPLFADRYVLRISSQGSFRIENLEDIELTMEMKVSHPEPVGW